MVWLSAPVVGDGGGDAVAGFVVFVASAAGDVDDDGVVFVDGFLGDGLLEAGDGDACFGDDADVFVFVEEGLGVDGLCFGDAVEFAVGLGEDVVDAAGLGVDGEAVGEDVGVGFVCEFFGGFSLVGGVDGVRVVNPGVGHGCEGEVLAAVEFWWFFSVAAVLLESEVCFVDGDGAGSAAEGLEVVVGLFSEELYCVEVDGGDGVASSDVVGAAFVLCALDGAEFGGEGDGVAVVAVDGVEVAGGVVFVVAPDAVLACVFGGEEDDGVVEEVGVVGEADGVVAVAGEDEWFAAAGAVEEALEGDFGFEVFEAAGVGVGVGVEAEDEVFKS